MSRAAWACRSPSWSIGTNRNDILARFFNQGDMTIGAGRADHLSPSMDIQVSSNFERLYFELGGRDGAAVAAAFAEFRKTGTLPVDQGAMGRRRARCSPPTASTRTQTRAAIASDLRARPAS